MKKAIFNFVILIAMLLLFNILPFGGLKTIKPKSLQTQTVCAGSPIPAGWIITDMQYNATACGNSGSRIIYNVDVISRYDNRQIGTSMGICSGQAIPAGWVVTESHVCVTCCGFQGSQPYNNVTTIKRIN